MTWQHCGTLSTWKVLVAMVLGGNVLAPVAIAQDAAPNTAPNIVPATDGTGTVVEAAGDRIDIDGGQRSLDGSNLFHSFQRFNVDAGQIANFLSSSEVRNILGRVTGEEASLIDGLLRVSGGNSNLYLMNPAGIVFGANARLDVPAGFAATTANAIGLGEGRWFEAIGANDWAALAGMPSDFRFDTLNPGSLVNLGDLAVAPSQELALVGGSVVTLGTLVAPGGRITVAAVPGQQILRLTPEGSLLSLDLPLGSLETLAASPLSLPELVVGQAIPNPTDLPPEPGATLVSGSVNVRDVDVRDGQGGQVVIAGNRLALRGATVDASGSQGGGTVRVGGELRGQGTMPTAQLTLVDRHSTLDVSATEVGNGGQAIVWADGATQFFGRAIARGGNRGGNGGLVEISGHDHLSYAGTVDLMAPAGLPGMVLFDPARIRVVAGDADSGADDAELADGVIAVDDGAADAEFVISRGVLEAIEGSVTLAATEVIEMATDVDFQAGNSETVRFEAGNSFASAGTLTTNGGNLEISAPNISLAGTLETGNLKLDGDTNLTGNLRINSSWVEAIGSVNGSHALNITASNVDLKGNLGDEIPLQSLDISSYRQVLLPTQIKVIDSVEIARDNGYVNEVVLLRNDTTIDAGSKIRLENLASIDAGMARDLTVRATGGEGIQLDNKRLQENPLGNLVLETGNGGDVDVGVQNLNLAGNFIVRSYPDAGGDVGDVRLPGGTIGGQLRVNAGGTIALPTGTDLRVMESISLVTTGAIQAQDGTNLQSAADVNLQAGQSIELADTVDNPLVISAEGDLNLSAATVLDIQGRNNPTSRLQAVGDITQTADTVNLDIPMLNDLGSSTVVAAGDVRFGDYKGLALKVEAGGSIAGGDIQITEPNPAEKGTDPDSQLLRTSPSLILRAGVTAISGTPNVPMTINGTNFQESTLDLEPGSILVGDITTRNQTNGGSVILSAVGDIVTGNINASAIGSQTHSFNTQRAGSVSIVSTNGDIQILDIDTSFGKDNSMTWGGQSGNIKIEAFQGNISASRIDISAQGYPDVATGSILIIRAKNDINLRTINAVSDYLSGGERFSIMEIGAGGVFRASGVVDEFGNYEPTIFVPDRSSKTQIIIRHGGNGIVIGGLTSDTAINVENLPSFQSGIANGIVFENNFSDRGIVASLRDATFEVGEHVGIEGSSNYETKYGYVGMYDLRHKIDLDTDRSASTRWVAEGLEVGDEFPNSPFVILDNVNDAVRANYALIIESTVIAPTPSAAPAPALPPTTTPSAAVPVPTTSPTAAPVPDNPTSNLTPPALNPDQPTVAQPIETPPATTPIVQPPPTLSTSTTVTPTVTTPAVSIPTVQALPTPGTIPTPPIAASTNTSIPNSLPMSNVGSELGSDLATNPISSISFSSIPTGITENRPRNPLNPLGIDLTGIEGITDTNDSTPTEDTMLVIATPQNAEADSDHASPDHPCLIPPDPEQILQIEIALPPGMTAPGVTPEECRDERHDEDRAPQDSVNPNRNAAESNRIPSNGIPGNITESNNPGSKAIESNNLESNATESNTTEVPEQDSVRDPVTAQPPAQRTEID